MHASRQRDVAALLTSADPSKNVAATFGIDTSNESAPPRRAHRSVRHRRQANSTYTLILANYGENVSITPPACRG